MRCVSVNPSALKASATEYPEDYILGTAGGRWISGNASVGVGVLYGKSSGRRDSPVYNAARSQTGTKSPTVATTAIGVMISSGYVF